jgi:chlorobactene glucosyltransferase
MYTGWQTLWPGVAKNLVDMAGGPRRLVVLAVAALALSWAAVLLPMFTAAACFAGQHAACVSMIPAFAGSAAAFALHLGGAAYFRIPIWYGLLFPIGYTAGALIALDSLRWRLSGFVRWKGRLYR